MLRAEIEKIPDGTYHAEGWLDDDGVTRDVPQRIGVKVIVEGDGVTVDLTDSPPQRPNALNTPYGGSTLVGVYSLFRTLLLDTFLSDDVHPGQLGRLPADHRRRPRGHDLQPEASPRRRRSASTRSTASPT